MAGGAGTPEAVAFDKASDRVTVNIDWMTSYAKQISRLSALLVVGSAVQIPPFSP